MGDKTTPKTDITAGYILEHHADIADHFREEGEKSVDVKAAQNTAATQERERIQSVMEQSMPGHEELIQKLAFDGQTTGPEAAVQVINAEKQVKVTTMANHRTDAPVVVPPASPKEPEKPQPGETLQEQWDADAELREEFNDDFNAFEAFENANKGGQVKIMGGKS